MRMLKARHKAMVERNTRLCERANAAHIAGATNGSTGMRKRAGALDPPHHMYSLVELIT